MFQEPVHTTFLGLDWLTLSSIFTFDKGVLLGPFKILSKGGMLLKEWGINRLDLLAGDQAMIFIL